MKHYYLYMQKYFRAAVDHDDRANEAKDILFMIYRRDVNAFYGMIAMDGGVFKYSPHDEDAYYSGTELMELASLVMVINNDYITHITEDHG